MCTLPGRMSYGGMRICYIWQNFYLRLCCTLSNKSATSAKKGSSSIHLDMQYTLFTNIFNIVNCHIILKF